MVAQWEWKGNSAHLDIQTLQIKGLKTRDHLFLMDTKPTFTKQGLETKACKWQVLI